ncbi:DUF7162 family protein [Mycolicibacterium komossense]|uniref:ESX-1 secretion-associated protein n=1 Tax=Mycolicibacterium komossense TaxID=1779 RepID=A0ABT3C6W6_9MYCO|nr:hypothetical protein [Mycolicibacterium komossense]MCV7225219.1 hypothetical protein [Mycolicibacterium komossense]
MAETPLTADLPRLRVVANRVDRAADAIDRYRCAGLHAEDLAGSAVGGIAAPAVVAVRLEDVVGQLRGWATAARIAASAFATAEQNSMARLDRP